MNKNNELSLSPSKPSKTIPLCNGILITLLRFNCHYPQHNLRYFFLNKFDINVFYINNTNGFFFPSLLSFFQFLPLPIFHVFFLKLSKLKLSFLEVFIFLPSGMVSAFPFISNRLL